MRPSLAIAFMFAVGMPACVPLQPQPSAPPAPVEAHVQQTGSADILFDEARELTRSGKYDEACPKLEASNRLDHTITTLYLLGDCYEHIGRIASAWEAFTQVASEAKRAGKSEHEKDARERAEQLKPRLPKLTIVVPESIASVPGLEIKRGDVVVGQPLWNKPVPVDPGDHVITAAAPSKRERRERVSIKEAEAREVSVQELDAVPMPRQRVAALAAGGVSIAAAVVGFALGGVAKSQWDAALAMCTGKNGEQVTIAKDCVHRSAAADDKEVTSKGWATASTVTLLVGTGAVAAAAALWFTAPAGDTAKGRTGWQIAPIVGPNGAGALVGRRF